MILYAILLTVFGVLMIIGGLRIYFTGVEYIYDYYTADVTDPAAYGCANGLALLLFALPTLICGVLQLLIQTNLMVYISIAVLVVALFVSFYFFLRIQKKYNGGMF